MSEMKQSRWIYRHENELRRALAGWAVSQHPYHRPPMLFEACDAFVGYLTAKHKTVGGVLRLHRKTLGQKITFFCKSFPLVARWNKPRKGKHKYVFCSRYDHPKPEYDFIDLDALARNVASQLLRNDF